MSPRALLKAIRPSVSICNLPPLLVDWLIVLIAQAMSNILTDAFNAITESYGSNTN